MAPEKSPADLKRIIRKLREALDLLKDKYQQSEGSWILADFMAAANDKDHWMNTVAEAETLSQPYMPRKNSS